MRLNAQLGWAPEHLIAQLGWAPELSLLSIYRFLARVGGSFEQTTPNVSALPFGNTMKYWEGM